MHYLDNAATTAVLPQCTAVVAEILRECWGNPASLYRAGMEAENRLKDARGTLAAALGCKPEAVYFTSGGTEANNMAIWGAVAPRRAWANKIVATGYEHASVSGPLHALAEDAGLTLITVPPGPDGTVDPDELAAMVDGKTALVCAMQVNNETGAVLDVEALAAQVKQKNTRCFVHVDGVQGFCKQPLLPGATRIDSYAVSGHKLRAPKGVGALYLRRGSNFRPPYRGGGQEDGLRPGTENVAYAAAFATAVEEAQKKHTEHAVKILEMRNRLLQGLATMDGIRVLSPAQGYAGIVMLALPEGYIGNNMLGFLDDNYGVCVSSGSACDKGEPSQTLLAMGLQKKEAEAALRVSFDGYNTPQDIDALLAGLRDGLGRLVHR